MIKSTKTGLFIGRFQPFHNGHLKAIENILEVCEKVIIVIGSAQEKNTPKNPFSSTQRVEMIKAVLEDDMEAIFDAVKWLALVQQAGGGTGFNFSKLRPKGDFVGNSGGFSICSRPAGLFSFLASWPGDWYSGGAGRVGNLGCAQR